MPTLVNSLSQPECLMNTNIVSHATSVKFDNVQYPVTLQIDYSACSRDDLIAMCNRHVAIGFGNKARLSKTAPESVVNVNAKEYVPRSTFTANDLTIEQLEAILASKRANQ